jgi:hypothetical protein
VFENSLEKILLLAVVVANERQRYIGMPRNIPNADTVIPMLGKQLLSRQQDRRTSIAFVFLYCKPRPTQLSELGGIVQ